jgi:hypothetical protein
MPGAPATRGKGLLQKPENANDADHHQSWSGDNRQQDRHRTASAMELHLPQVLSQEEVTRLIEAAALPFHRIPLMTLNATRGLRFSAPFARRVAGSRSHRLGR